MEKYTFLSNEFNSFFIKVTITCNTPNNIEIHHKSILECIMKIHYEYANYYECLLQNKKNVVDHRYKNLYEALRLIPDVKFTLKDIEKVVNGDVDEFSVNIYKTTKIKNLSTINYNVVKESVGILPYFTGVYSLPKGASLTFANKLNNLYEDVVNGLNEKLLDIKNANSIEVTNLIKSFHINFIKKWIKQKDIIKMMEEYTNFMDDISGFKDNINTDTLELYINPLTQLVDNTRETLLKDINEYIDPFNDINITIPIEKNDYKGLSNQLSKLKCPSDTINAKIGSQGTTPFLRACSKCNTSIINLLLIYGTDLGISDHFNYTYEDYIEKGHIFFNENDLDGELKERVIKEIEYSMKYSTMN